MENCGQVRKKRKGGIAQRMAQSAKEASLGTSKILMYLLNRVAWGFMQVLDALRTAKEAKHDIEAAAGMDSRVGGGPFPDLDKVAGVPLRSAKRNVRQMIIDTPDLPSPLATEHRVADPLGELMTYMMLPHEMFSYIYNHYYSSFRMLFCPKPGILEKFWNLQMKHPQMQDHPVQKRPDWKRNAIPVALHGDEVPVLGTGKVWSKSYLSFAWFGLLTFTCKGLKTAEYMLWIWGAFDQYLATGDNDTIDQFLIILAWSFEAMFQGRWPEADWMRVKCLHIT